jgi:hypothetical protein
MKTLAFLALFLPFIAFAHVDNAKCAHNRHKEVPEFLEVDEEPLPTGSRLLQTVTYPNIRITVDYTQLTLGDSGFIAYVKQHLLPPVIDYFESAIKVKQPLTNALKLSTSITTICGFPVPNGLRVGTITDFYVIVSSESDTDNWVASAGACYLSSTTRRPLIAKMLFNTMYTKAASDDLLSHEKNMYLTMHEMIHALGFAGSSFKNFIDANGVLRTGHIKSVILGGSTYTVLDVEPLTSKLRAHFGCSTLPGAFMEDDGGAGTEGSHFERRHFLYETMTSGVIHGRRLSEFSFAVLEGSGWYFPNYTYAEPFYFGKGQGCNFLYMNCSSSNFNFEEFCKDSGRRCTPVGRGGGVCTEDSRSDNCSYSIPAVDYDCENPTAEDAARFPELQVFGRETGAKCFDGNLTKLTKTTPTTFCFKYTCSGTGLSTILNVQIANISVRCPSEGYPIRLSGYNGAIYCPDPITFCGTVGKKYCPRNCLGRGSCVSGKCVCQTGYRGVDCALSSTWGL